LTRTYSHAPFDRQGDAAQKLEDAAALIAGLVLGEKQGQ
jgi:hypothetical protein